MEGWASVVVGRVYGWDVLGKAVWAETEPRSAAEPQIRNSSQCGVSISAQTTSSMAFILLYSENFNILWPLWQGIFDQNCLDTKIWHHWPQSRSSR